MNYITVAEAAENWGLSERSVRNYCTQGRISNAYLKGKTWCIPDTAEKPLRINRDTNLPITLAAILKAEKTNRISGGIYHRIQVDLTYNSNHIEGSRLTHDQTRYIFETNTIRIEKESVNVNDVLEAINHFRSIDIIIDSINNALNESYIKKLHSVLLNGLVDSQNEWFLIGEYKKLPNEVGGNATASPEDTPRRMKKLLADYSKNTEKSLEELIDFHYQFEAIHPFQDGNGRIGRLILLKECLRNNIVPFIIDEELKIFYYRGLHEWTRERGYLIDTCLAAQDKFKRYLDYFKISYE